MPSKAFSDRLPRIFQGSLPYHATPICMCTQSLGTLTHLGVWKCEKLDSKLNLLEEQTPAINKRTKFPWLVFAVST